MIRTVVAAEEDYQLLIRLRFVTVIEATIFELLLVVAITSFWRASFCSSFFIYNLYTTQLSNLSICRWLPSYKMGSRLTCKQNKKKFQKTGFQSQLFLNFFVVIFQQLFSKCNNYYIKNCLTVYVQIIYGIHIQKS